MRQTLEKEGGSEGDSVRWNASLLVLIADRKHDEIIKWIKILYRACHKTCCQNNTPNTIRFQFNYIQPEQVPPRAIWQVNKRELHLCAEMCVSAGLYEEDNQWITQINRLQKLIDRLEKKATGYTNDFCLSHYKAFSLSVITLSSNFTIHLRVNVMKSVKNMSSVISSYYKI